MTRTMPGGGTAIGTKINSGTLPVMAFAAHLGSPQPVREGAAVPVSLNVEELDTEGWYDHINSFFNPDVPGVYLVAAQLSLSEFNGILTLYLMRGSNVVGQTSIIRTGGPATVSLSTIVTMNGTNDALTMAVGHTSAGPHEVVAASMSGVLLGRVG